MMEFNEEQLNKKSYELRKRFLELFINLGFGHVTSAFSWTEIAVVLHYVVMDNEKDRFVLSKGHGAGMLFPIYEDLGLVDKNTIEEALKIGGDLSEINEKFYPGFDFYGGSLGIGIGVACGMAKSVKMKDESKRIFCVLGDAECYEGSVWEAANFAGHNKLDNLIVIVDRNMLGCSDFTEKLVQLEPFKDRWEAFNWDVIECDGHNVSEVYETIKTIMNNNTGRPKCIIANTKKGYGLDYLIDKPLMHGFVPKSDIEIEKAFLELHR